MPRRKWRAAGPQRRRDSADGKVRPVGKIAARDPEPETRALGRRVFLSARLKWMYLSFWREFAFLAAIFIFSAK